MFLQKKTFDISTNMTVRRGDNHIQPNLSISVHWGKEQGGLKQALPVCQCCTPSFHG